ncbi:OmpA family protein [Pseudomethylobacillus aquaticus]|uniref:Peptidoglycan-associated lipoprotein n=1 Tax=Pseudomethylobacillus aquaticus TaxID=2676064 RepID=A0A3N0V3C8_9PROT|nr:OmpA family protein [Pseudomethylobacillus aquaticus]ROH87054.1 OmpA family protein [Pseudomethylobacillus aquaticus]
MNKQLMASLLVVLLLGACSNKAAKDASAPVADKSPAMADTGAPAAGGDTVASVVADDESGKSALLNDPSSILYKRSIYFDYDSDTINAEYRPLIEAHAKYLLAHPNARMVLQGNTDERGAREYNLSLGQRRAVAVKRVMNVLGVQDTQIETVSFGEEKAKLGCAAESCYKDDRRVDIAYQVEK